MESTGILRNYCWHSARIPAEFHRYFSGIPVKIQDRIVLELLPAFCTVLQLEFHWNFTKIPGQFLASIPLKIQDRILLELLLAFREDSALSSSRNSSGIFSWCSTFLLEFGTATGQVLLNSTGIPVIIPDYFS